ncbi:hypothetical protein C1637_14375 [Chryseobacterium lactis]|uniref:Uncharacterized protein n=1 Tax=Chryseobacterium lactis TaxID=1241981 RepID=A0A3G6RM67_CHRLC|nr:hypothetical protein [Chryseobacterium lactis]AZA83692.1 hypothetical protein EG342_18190 [Chryseobacterium lactis]AZB04077.1 hypothetical protein EG341_09065 [Chryseobacterium lactis]PNW13015.1 hypothetical protein C1637_14375 [Chryseobacterium lactis]
MPTDASHKLIPMTTFVIEYYSNEGYADLQILNLMNNYANFLKKPLSLGMFVPVDVHGNVLKEPKNYASWKSLEHNDGKRTDTAGFEEYTEYQKAEVNCMFEGFKVDYNGYSKVRITASYDPSIELSFNKNDLLPAGYNDVESLTVFDDIFLTTSALKAIGIKNL